MVKGGTKTCYLILILLPIVAHGKNNRSIDRCISLVLKKKGYKPPKSKLKLSD